MRVFPRNFSKYKAVKVTTPTGEKFDSGLEYKRWLYLKQLEANGEIKDLRRQVPYELIPSQKGPDGKVLFRELKYVADFVYTIAKTGEEVVEDTKGIILPEFKLKMKLMYWMRIKANLQRKCI